MLCLTTHFCGTCTVVTVHASSVNACVVRAVIYMVAIPLGWLLWYGRVYNAAKNDGTLGFVIFFLVFFAHLVFCIWSAVGKPRLTPCLDCHCELL